MNKFMFELDRFKRELNEKADNFVARQIKDESLYEDLTAEDLHQFFWEGYGDY